MKIKKLLSIFSKKSKSKLEAFLRQALINYQHGDLDLCRQALDDYLAIAKTKTVKKCLFKNFDEGNAVFEMLHQLDFDDYPEGSPGRILYLGVFLYC